MSLRRDTTNRGLLPCQGTTHAARLGVVRRAGRRVQVPEAHGQLRRLPHARAKTCSIARRSSALHVDAGYIYSDAPFFERFYGGGIGQRPRLRVPRHQPPQRPRRRPVGGDFSLTGQRRVSFPLAGDTLRGVVFADVGTVEEDFEINTVRTSVGAGIRLILPFLGQAPIAVDFALPITKDDEDDTQVISFSFGVAP